MDWVIIDRKKDHLARLFDLALDLLVVAGFDGYVVAANPACERTLGFSAGELASRPFFDWFHPEDVDAASAQLARLMAGDEIVDFELRLLCRDGSYRWTQWRAIAALDAEVVYASGRDVTERRRQDEDRGRLAEELARSNAALEDFAVIAAHDLRSPLAAIQGLTLLLAGRPGLAGDAEASELASRAAARTTRMATQIDALLTYCRTGGRIEIRPVNLDAALEEVRGVLAPQLDDSGGRIVAGSLPVVQGDAALLTEVLQNLIANALSAARPGSPPVVEVMARRCDQGWEIAVADNGVGIPPDERDAVFDLFARGSSADADAGTGIGLAVCRRVVEGHGGRIAAVDSPRGGCQIVFTLPDHDGPDVRF